MSADISTNSILISCAILFATWVLKAAVWGLKELGSKLVDLLVKTIAKVEVLEAQISQVLSMAADIHKVKRDLAEGFNRIRLLEAKLNSAPTEGSNRPTDGSL